jgi:hypothetical protein
MPTDNYEHYVIGIRYTQKYRMSLALQKKHPKYYQGYNAHKGEVPDNALLIFRAYYAILNETKTRRFTPTCTVVWDKEPSRANILNEIAKGHLACLTTHTEHTSIKFSNLLEALTRYQAGHASFDDLCQAASITSQHQT